MIISQEIQNYIEHELQISSDKIQYLGVGGYSYSKAGIPLLNHLESPIPTRLVLLAELEKLLEGQPQGKFVISSAMTHFLLSGEKDQAESWVFPKDYNPQLYTLQRYEVGIYKMGFRMILLKKLQRIISDSLDESIIVIAAIK